MKVIVLTAIALFGIVLSEAAPYPYDWEAGRKQYTLSPEEKDLAEVILKKHVEYAYAYENDQFVMYSVFHKIVRVNNNEAIQRNNRITISLFNTIELLEVKARTINAQGKVLTFDKESIKEVKDETTGSGYRIFAMDGLELGSEVEYLFVKKVSPFVFGREYLQHDVPVKHASFLMKSPKHLEFDFRTYNGLPGVQSRQEGEENIYRVEATGLKAIKGEDFSIADAWNQRIEFKLQFNRKKSNARLYTWANAGTEFYQRLFVLNKDEEKSVRKFAESLKDNPSKDEQTRIRAVERHIKSMVHVDEKARNGALSDIPSILKNKVASEEGMTKVFVATFGALNIPVQLVITCNRSFRAFDGGFDSWNFLDEYLLYFPRSNTYLSPYSPALISPLVDPIYAGNKGLFIEPIEVASVKSALASVKEIPSPSWEYSIDRSVVDIAFNESLEENIVYSKNVLTGYKASIIAPYYDFMAKDQQQKVIEEFAKGLAPGVTVDQWSAKTDFSGKVDAFSMDMKFNTPYFLERAGPRILLKLGLAIGPQSELYNNEPRSLPVDNETNRGYERTVTLTIPDGYSIRNPGDLNFNVYSTGSADAPYSFVSSYKMEGRKLVVTINEYYKQISCPLESYEGFRKVINAAADFNKVTLVLEATKP